MSDFEPRGLSPDAGPAFPNGFPKGMKYEDTGHELAFSWRWFRSHDYLGLFVAVMWIAMSVLFFASPETEGLVDTVASLYFVAFGIFAAFQGTRRVMNRTHVRVVPGELSVTSGPFFGRRDVMLNPMSLEQLYVRRSRFTRWKTDRIIYEVHAITRDADDVLVAGNLTHLEHAHWIEGQIERYLEISEKPVTDSLSRPVRKKRADRGNIINPPLIDPDQV